MGIETAFASETVTLLDERYDYTETRFITLGVLHRRVVVIAHTETDEVIRIISVRKATKNEAKTYRHE